MIFPLSIGIFSAVLFFFFQAQGIYTGDSGDLVTAAATLGVAHPPGYPLYTFLGWILSHVPVFTPSWRVSLLSSVPSAFALVALYIIVFRLTKDTFAAVFSVLTLMGNYVFFLYSVTPEVFALYNLFVVLLILTLIQWKETRNSRFVAVASFLFGLALTHQHVILFLVPALAFFLWDIQALPQHKRRIVLIRSFVWGAVGLIPYVYAPIAASFDSIINWDRPVTLAGFWRLVTRADYGTFISGSAFGQTLLQRLLSVRAYGDFVRLDVGVIGIILAIMGIYFLWQKKTSVAQMLLIALFFLGPVFFFYASFPLVSRFTLATYERFLLPSYSIIAILVGIGVHEAILRAAAAFQKLVSREVAGIGKALFGACLLIVPLTFLAITLWRFWGLSTDRTAENLGRDVLASAPPNSIIILYQDTPLFTTQYVRYGLGVRTDTIVLHGSRLTSLDYRHVMSKNFPSIKIPKSEGSQFLIDFIEQNAADRPVLSNMLLPLGKQWYWVPHGLLYEMVPERALPTVSQTVATNAVLWGAFHDPKQGILGRYMHLMLSDTLDVYATYHVALGKTMARAGLWQDAGQEFSAAASLGGDVNTADAFVLLGIIRLRQSDCQGALSAFEEAKKHKFTVDSTLLLVQSITFRDCLKDAARASELYSEYEKLQRRSEQPLDQL